MRTPDSVSGPSTITPESLGWGPDFEVQLRAHERDDAALQTLRVAAVHRTRLTVVGPGFTTTEPRDALPGETARSPDPRDRPTVGDWVVVRSLADGQLHVERVLVRRGAIARSRSTGAPQLIAANVDVVFVATSCNQDLNARRLERYLVAIREARATPVILLTKTDLVDAEGLAEARALCERVAGDAEICAVCAPEGRGMDRVRELVGPGTTAAVVGSSGVGKSTMLNALLGSEVQVTAGLRDDDKGRHATTHRELFALPTGGWLIDTPGMRELGMWAESGELGTGVAETFADVESLAACCKFRDCAHQGEPGCAVGAAIDAGELDPWRLESYRKLCRELARLELKHDPDSRENRRRRREEHQARRRRAKAITKFARNHKKRRGR